MRLANFIRSEMDAILEDWEAFAKSIHHARHLDKKGRRDHAGQMLLEIAKAIDTQQSQTERVDKSCRLAAPDIGSSWAEVHGHDRQTSGFTVTETVSEFRALRESVVSHWTRTVPAIAEQQLEDLACFHKAIDQAVARSLDQYTTVKETESRQFGAILAASPDPIYVLDVEGRLIYANKATAELFALKTEDIIGKSAFDLGFSFALEFHRNLEKVIADRCSFRGKFIHAFASGHGERFEYVLAPVLDEDRDTEAIVCIFRDITEQEIAEEKVWHNAHHDYLTGLPNRRLFLERLKQEIKHANRGDLSLAVLFLDLDGFKAVNDSLGHEAGDCLLHDVSARLTNCLRDQDTVARLGGDEFTVISTGVRKDRDAETVARNIIDALEQPFYIEGEPVRISASVGISFFPQDALAPEALLRAADHAMYSAKSSGCTMKCFSALAENTDMHTA